MQVSHNLIACVLTCELCHLMRQKDMPTCFATNVANGFCSETSILIEVLTLICSHEPGHQPELRQPCSFSEMRPVIAIFGRILVQLRMVG